MSSARMTTMLGRLVGAALAPVARTKTRQAVQTIRAIGIRAILHGFPFPPGQARAIMPGDALPRRSIDSPGGYEGALPLARHGPTAHPGIIHLIHPAHPTATGVHREDRSPPTRLRTDSVMFTV